MADDMQLEQTGRGEALKSASERSKVTADATHLPAGSLDALNRLHGFTAALLPRTRLSSVGLFHGIAESHMHLAFSRCTRTEAVAAP